MRLPSNVNDYLVRRSSDLASNFIEETLSNLEMEYESGRVISSPIEQIFLIEWRYQEHLRTAHFPFGIEPQYNNEEATGKYYVDFSIDFINDESDAYDKWGTGYTRAPLVGIELDGHEWHEKSKRQVEYHKERERFLIAKGWALIRFAGTEVVKHPEKCVREALDFIWKKRNEYRKQVVALGK